MKESDILSRWESDRPIYQAWANYVARVICDNLALLIDPQPLEDFLKLPVKPRLKSAQSLVDKALHRGKNYTDPYGDITDKAGVRFVVLLTSDIKKVEETIHTNSDWEYSKDKDYEEERLARPLEFSYQSVHYVVRAREDMEIDGISIPAGTACEVQVRTLLQHAHSELTHDTIYKPKTTAAPHVHRTVAKSMALIEAADDFFENVVSDLDQASKTVREALDILAGLYRNMVGNDPEFAKSNLIILDAFADKLGNGFRQRLESLLQSKPYIIDRVSEHAESQHLFRQPAILLAYLLANTTPAETKYNWPLPPDELRSVFLDLGLNFDGY